MKLHTTLSLYISRHFLLALLGSLLVIMALIVMLDYIELMRRSASRGEIAASLLLTMALLKSPTMLHQILPFAVLIGGMIAMWRLSRSHELVVMRSVGVSIWQFLAPPMIMMFVVGVLDVTVVNPVGSSLYKTYNRMEDSLILQQKDAFNFSEGGLWLREALENDEQMVVHASEVRQDGIDLLMRNLSFIRLDANEQFIERTEASLGKLADKRFELSDVWLMRAGEPSQHLDTLTLPTSLTLGRVQEKFASPESLSFWELPRFIAFFEAAGFSASHHRMYFYSLLASPLLLCAMILMAAVFSVSPNQRSGRGMMRVLGAVAAGFMLYFFSKLTAAFGLSTSIPLWLSAWTPTLVTLMLGATTLLHLEDG